MWKKNSNKESGMLTVEAILTLVPFILVILGIISFTNIFMVHNKIQYAIFEAGNELSSYTYLYEVTGIRAADQALKEDIDEETKDIDATIKYTNDFFEQIGTIGGNNNAISGTKETIDTGGLLLSKIQTMISNPKKILSGGVYLGIETVESKLKEFLIGLLSEGFVEIYLDQSFSPYNPMTADEYLQSYGVVGGLGGLTYDESKLFQDENLKIIDIVVEYDIEIYFFKLFLKDPTIHMVQRCAIPAWLDGDGVDYIK